MITVNSFRPVTMVLVRAVRMVLLLLLFSVWCWLWFCGVSLGTEQVPLGIPTHQLCLFMSHLLLCLIIDFNCVCEHTIILLLIMSCQVCCP